MTSRPKMLAVIAAAMMLAVLPATAAKRASASADQVQAIAEKTFIFAYPMMENYKTMYSQAVDKTSKSYQAPFNEFYHARKLLNANFTTIVSPNNDTLYSMAWLDLRAEPIVLSVPKVADKRYFSFQMVDMYTFNFAYVGSRATGWDGGKFLIAAADWKGDTPAGITKVLRADSQFIYLLGRTAVNGDKDIPAAPVILE